MRRRRAASIIALALTLSMVALSCGDSTSPTTSDTSPTTSPGTPPPVGGEVIAISNASRVLGNEDAIADVVLAANAFATDLYPHLITGEDNLVFSPHSIAIALAMTRAGAAGSTAAEMDAVLHLAEVADANGGFNALDAALDLRSGTFTRGDGTDAELILRVANALWGQQGTTFEDPFLDTLAEQYGAGMRLVDYRTDADAARIEINDWVADQTEDRIEDLIPEGALNDLTRLVLTNAVYLLAPWESPFEPDATSPGVFTVFDGTQVQADLMRQSSNFRYASGDGWQAVELPYAGRELAMVVIVPDAGRFAEIESALDASMIGSVNGALALVQVNLAFPTFEFRTQKGLTTALHALGLEEALDPNSADFSKMTAEEQLFIAEVIHEAFIAVDEEGTEAAAATAVVMAATSAPENPVNLNVDRPFLFEIVDMQTGAVLFLGRVMNPTG